MARRRLGPVEAIWLNMDRPANLTVLVRASTQEIADLSRLAHAGARTR